MVTPPDSDTDICHNMVAQSPKAILYHLIARVLNHSSTSNCKVTPREEHGEMHVSTEVWLARVVCHWWLMTSLFEGRGRSCIRARCRSRLIHGFQKERRFWRGGKLYGFYYAQSDKLVEFWIIFWIFCHRMTDCLIHITLSYKIICTPFFSTKTMLFKCNFFGWTEPFLLSMYHKGNIFSIWLRRCDSLPDKGLSAMTDDQL